MPRSRTMRRRSQTAILNVQTLATGSAGCRASGRRRAGGARATGPRRARQARAVHRTPPEAEARRPHAGSRRMAMFFGRVRRYRNAPVGASRAGDSDEWRRGLEAQLRALVATDVMDRDRASFARFRRRCCGAHRNVRRWQPKPQTANARSGLRMQYRPLEEAHAGPKRANERAPLHGAPRSSLAPARTEIGPVASQRDPRRAAPGQPRSGPPFVSRRGSGALGGGPSS